MECRREHRAANTEHRTPIRVLHSPICDLRWGATRRATTTTTSSLRRRDRPWVSGLLGLILVCVLGIFFFFFFFFYKHLCALCLVCWVLCLVCFCIGVWSLCQRRRDVMPGASNVMGWLGSISDSILFFLVENGLAVSELPVMGSPWAWLAMDGLGFVIYIYIYIFFFFFFLIFFQFFFGFFFFFFFFAWK